MRLILCAACLLALAGCAGQTARPAGRAYCPPQNVVDISGNCVAPDVPDPEG